MTVVAIGDALQERRALAAARALDVVRGRLVDGAHVLAVDGMRRDAKRLRAGGNVAGRGFLEVRVLVIAVVLAHEDDGKLPQLGEVHLLVEDALTERALAEEAHGDAPVLQILRRVGRARGDAGAAAHDGVGAQVASGRRHVCIDPPLPLQ